MIIFEDDFYDFLTLQLSFKRPDEDKNLKKNCFYLEEVRMKLFI